MATGPVLETLCTRLTLQERVKADPSSFVQMQKKDFHGWKKIQLLKSRFSGIWPWHKRKHYVTKGPLRDCCRRPESKEMSLPWGLLQVSLCPWGSFDCLIAPQIFMRLLLILQMSFVTGLLNIQTCCLESNFSIFQPVAKGKGLYL